MHKMAPQGAETSSGRVTGALGMVCTKGIKHEFSYVCYGMYGMVCIQNINILAPAEAGHHRSVLRLPWECHRGILWYAMHKSIKDDFQYVRYGMYGMVWYGMHKGMKHIFGMPLPNLNRFFRSQSL